MLTAEVIRRPCQDPVDQITLDETARHRRRIKMVSDGGITFLLSLPEARLLRGGDGIELSDGRQIEVVAAREALYEIKGRDPQHLLALAWQIGNRHLSCQIVEDRMLIRRDPVIRDMLIGLGADVAEVQASFDPESGAYHSGHHHD